MYNLYTWLVEKFPNDMMNKATVIDIGAYQGDFTKNMLATEKFAKAHLFEPNPEHFTFLQNEFSEQGNIFLHPYALGNQIGKESFNCSEDDATGSVLRYHPKYHHDTSQKKVKSFSINLTKLDDFYIEHFSQDRIGLIKIDTQGFDLEVLKGAENLIRDQKPWLVIELNFLPFYIGQASIHSIMHWLSEQGYHLGGMFNDHYSNDQWLAFADGVFIPVGTVDKVIEPFQPRVFSDELIEQNKILQRACEERLALINHLHNNSGREHRIIGKLKKYTGYNKLKNKFI